MPYYTMRDGEQIFAYVIGDGSPCVLVNGFVCVARVWVPLISTLKGVGCQFILMDVRGSGESATARYTKPAFEQFAEDVDDLLDALGHAQAKLVGCSQGAYACLVKYKVTGFSRITSFLLYEHTIKVAPSDGYKHGINPEVFEKYRALVAMWKHLNLDDPRVPFKKLPPEFRRAYRATCMETIDYCCDSIRGGKVTKPLIRAAVSFIQSSTIMWHGTMKIMEDYVHHDYGISLKDLEHMNLPVTILYARRSRLFPNDAILEMAESMPNVKVIRYENSGHAIFQTEPWKFRADLAQFLAGPSRLTVLPTTNRPAAAARLP
ncbi:MAG TPA: alpha/beta hydrolase [Steroidobacter sp.]|uniref:alpha/beta fold hydrolase n=1 Tax=Steroidobacter sp. TaxID=1978227 RepID=UPI002ED9CCF9